MSNKKVFTDESLSTFVSEIKMYTDRIVANKQDKNLVVTKGSDGLASHTPAEVLAHVQAGGKAVYNDGGTEHAYLEGNSATTVFYSSFINNNNIQFSIYQLMSDKTITSSRSNYTPPVTSVNGKTGDVALTASDVNTYTKEEIDNLELVTVDDIDAVCSGTIQMASGVEF